MITGLGETPKAGVTFLPPSGEKLPPIGDIGGGLLLPVEEVEPIVSIEVRPFLTSARAADPHPAGIFSSHFECKAAPQSLQASPLPQTVDEQTIQVVGVTKEVDFKSCSRREVGSSSEDSGISEGK